MRTQIYDHRSGLKVVPNDIVADVKNIIWNINPALSKKTVSSLKESVRERLEKEGWTGEYRLDATSRITISSYLRGVGLCFQTGNVGRIYADPFEIADSLYKRKYNRWNHSCSPDKNSKRTWIQYGKLRTPD